MSGRQLAIGDGRWAGFGVIVLGLTLILTSTNIHATDESKQREGMGVVHGYSAAALFNQGNAFAREGKPGLAILNYERARLLSPNDEGIVTNLHLVRAKAGLPDSNVGYFERISSLASPNTMAWIGSFGLVIIGAGALILFFHPRRRANALVLAFFGILLVVGTFGNAIVTWPMLKEAVVIKPESEARISPSSFSGTSFKFREGGIVSVSWEHNGFSLVENSEGRAGWISTQDLERIIPKSVPGG